MFGDRKTTAKESPTVHDEGSGEKQEKGSECPLITDVGGFEHAAIIRKRKRAGGYPLLSERFNGEFAWPVC